MSFKSVKAFAAAICLGILCASAAMPIQAAAAQSVSKAKTQSTAQKNQKKAAPAAAADDQTAGDSGQDQNAQNAAAEADAQEQNTLPPPEAVVTSALSSSVRLGEPFKVVVEITHDPSVAYSPARDLNLGPDADILDVKTAHASSGGSDVTTISITAALFKLGEIQLPEISLTASDGMTEQNLKAEGPALTCTGDMAEGETAELSDILPPVEVGIPSYMILWIVLSVLAFLGLLFVAIQKWKKRKPKPAKQKPLPPPAPLDVRTLSALQALLKEEVPDQKKVRELFFRLSEIERGYLGERYNFSALDMTTPELLTALRKIHTPGLDIEKFERRSCEGDLVRFAKAPMPASECSGAIQDAIDMVVQTTNKETDRQRAAAAGTAVSAGRKP